MAHASKKANSDSFPTLLIPGSSLFCQARRISIFTIVNCDDQLQVKEVSRLETEESLLRQWNTQSNSDDDADADGSHVDASTE
jgi:hypothetical protein